MFNLLFGLEESRKIIFEIQIMEIKSNSICRYAVRR